MVSFLDLLNAIFHIPVIGDLITYVYWGIVLILSPLAGLVIFLLDHISGHACTMVENKVGQGEEVVVITGCDRGFGRALAVRCMARGFKTYAACLTTKGAQELAMEAPGVHTAVVDVTNEAAVQGLAEWVEAENPGGVYAVVNNAGVARNGVVDWLTLKDYRAVMEVNFFAMISVTKAFLPLLKRAEGRVINVSSIMGLMCGLPLVSAYQASKYAVEAFTSSLRVELQPFKVKVITISPGLHRTSIIAQSARSAMEQHAALPSDIQTQYPPAYVKSADDMITFYAERMAYDPKHVADAMEQALVARWPRVMYSVGMDARVGVIPLVMLPKRVAEAVVYYIMMPLGMRSVNKHAGGTTNPVQTV